MPWFQTECLGTSGCSGVSFNAAASICTLLLAGLGDFVFNTSLNSHLRTYCDHLPGSAVPRNLREGFRFFGFCALFHH